MLVVSRADIRGFSVCLQLGDTMQRCLPVEQTYGLTLFDGETAVDDVLSAGDLCYDGLGIGPAGAEIPDDIGRTIHGCVQGEVITMRGNITQVVQSGCVPGRGRYAGILVDILRLPAPVAAAESHPVQPIPG